jgi:hypothetical protein
VGGIQVLAGLAPSRKTVGSNKEIQEPPFKVAPNTPKNLKRASAIISYNVGKCQKS